MAVGGWVFGCPPPAAAGSDPAPPSPSTHILRMMISFLAAFRTLRPSRFRNFLQVYSLPDVFSFARKISQNSSLQGSGGGEGGIHLKSANQ